VQVRTLGLETDLIYVRFEGEVLERADYLALRSPRQPTFYWGNLLAFSKPPGPGDDERWEELFQREFASLPAVRHRAFTWDDPEGRAGQTAPFLEAGFGFECNQVLSATSVVAPPRPLDELAVRPLVSDADWEAALANQIRSIDAGQNATTFAAFKQQRMRTLRAMTDAGLGHWYGGFLDGRLVGDLGIFVDGELGRFHEVVTDPEHRRRGVCGTLVQAASRHAFEKQGVRRLIVVAEPEGVALRVYRSLGFQEIEHQAGLLRRPDHST